jgi:uroporphyrinogen decarboxylase
MNSRERVWMALNHNEPDRIPIDAGSTVVTSIHLEAYERLKNFIGIKGGKVEVIDYMQQLAKLEEEVLERFHVDTRRLTIKPAQGWKKVSENLFQNEWGIKFSKPSSSHYYEMVEHPLAHTNIKELSDYPWPNPYDPRRIEGLEREAKRLYYETSYAIVLRAGLIESCFAFPSWLRGYAQFYKDLVSNKEFINALLDELFNFIKALVDMVLQLVGKYVQVVMVGDDLGTQQGPLISPKLYKNLIKPRQKELYTFIKKRTDAKLLLHSCGSIYRFIADFIEVGVDALNPIQVSAQEMDTKRLKTQFGNKLAFWGGGCDTQHILPFGTPTQVRAEVKKRIKDLAPGGGFIFAPVHNIQYDVSPENICALYDAAYEWGKYPLRIS